MRYGILAAVAALIALVLVPPTAGAATKSVNLGLPAKQGKAFGKLVSDVNDFFPHGVTIHVGDTVRFVPTGFHSLDLPTKGGKAHLPFATSSDKIAGVNDESGAPFWFNGQDTVGFDPALLPPGFGKKFTYDGSKAVLSGLPLGNKLKPLQVKFTKAGSFTYFCDVHQGMKGVVKVVKARKAIPSAKADAKSLKAQLAAATKVAKGLAATQVPTGEVSVGASGKGGVELFAMLPATTTVPAGTTVTFRMSAKSLDIHTATFGPGDPEADPNSFLGKVAASLGTPGPGQLSVYPSDPPGTTASLTPTLHGNGFWGTGLMDASKAYPGGSSGSVKFTAAGTYQFYCMIHPFMHGTVVVT